MWGERREEGAVDGAIFSRLVANRISGPEGEEKEGENGNLKRRRHDWKGKGGSPRVGITERGRTTLSLPETFGLLWAKVEREEIVSPASSHLCQAGE